MAVRQVATTDSLDKLRTEFNALALSDFGDIATLDSSLSATTVIGAVNEINAIAIAAAGFTLTDGTNTQAVASGNTLTINTGTNLEAIVPILFKIAEKNTKTINDIKVDFEKLRVDFVELKKNK